MFIKIFTYHNTINIGAILQSRTLKDFIEKETSIYTEYHHFQPKKIKRKVKKRFKSKKKAKYLEGNSFVSKIAEGWEILLYCCITKLQSFFVGGLLTQICWWFVYKFWH